MERYDGMVRRYFLSYARDASPSERVLLARGFREEYRRACMGCDMSIEDFFVEFGAFVCKTRRTVSRRDRCSF